MKNVNVPPLSLNPADNGLRYMVARHRKMMAEKFGAEFPKGALNQKQLMKMLKADDPEKYNKWFDILVRGVEPEAETVNYEVEITEAMESKIAKKIADYESESHRAIKKQIEDVGEHYKRVAEQEAKKYNKVVFEVKRPDITKKVKGPLPPEFQDILDLMSARINMMLIGPTGCGKTHISKVAAESLGLEFASQSCSAGMSESAFAGWLLPTGKNAQFTYVQSEFVRLYENGGVFLFDEIDASDSNTLLFINQALANDSFYLPQRFDKPEVKRHPDFVAIGAANTYGNGATSMYSGRNILDGATMDRFRMGIVEMDYSEKVESVLVDPEVLKYGQQIRHIIKQKSMRRAMSTRFLIDASKMKFMGWSMEKIFKTYFSDWTPEEKVMVNNYIELEVA